MNTSAQARLYADRAATNESDILPPPRAPAEFVGRDGELEQLLVGLSGAEQRAGGLFLLIGEAGIGKTRLADELCEIAAARGFSTHWGRCWESGGAPAYWPWTQIFSTLVSSEGPHSPEAVTCDPLALSPLVPELCAELPPGGSTTAAAKATGTDVRESRFRTFRAALALLTQAARRRPLVLILDDLHAADQSSLLLLEFVARELRGLRVVIIGTHKDHEASVDPDVGALLARIGREGRTLPLRRLGASAVGALVRRRMPAVADATVAAIFQATQGNPLFLDQVVRTLEADAGPGMRTCVADLELPFGLRKAIALHLDRLSPEARPVIEAASVLGSEFRTPPLAAVAQMAITDVEAILSGSLATGVVVLRGRCRYAFSSGLIREALYRGLPRPKRAELHARAAQTLAEGSREDERPWAEIAHHRFEAGPAALDAAVDAAIRAAAVALTAMAHEDAFALLERAHLALEFEPSRRKARAELCLAQALTHFRTADAARGRAFYARALGLARALGDPDFLARVALADGIELSAIAPELHQPALLDEALAALPVTDSPVRASVMARRAATHASPTTSDESMALARGAIAMARRLGHGPTLLAVIHEGMAAMMDFVHPDERLALDTELERLCTEFGDRPRALRAHARLVFDHLGRGEIAGADRRIAAYEQVAAQLPPGPARWRSALFRAMRALMEGRFADAQRLAEQAEATALALGDGSAGPCLVGHQLAAIRAREAHHDFPRVISGVRASWGDTPGTERVVLVLSAVTALRVGEREKARRALDQAAISDLIPGADAGLLGHMAEACAGAGDRDLGERLYQRLESYSGWLMNCGLLGMYCEGPYDRQLGLLASALGRPQQARVHFEAAINRNRALGLRPHLSRVLYEQAWALHESRDDRDRVLALASEASAIAHELEQTILAEQIDVLICASRTKSGAVARAAAGQPSERTAGFTPPAFELRREGEFWSVICAEGVLRLKDSRGLETLERLLGQPDQELHAIELAALVPGPTDLGDSGELLDREARTAYRERLADLREQLEEAESTGDAQRAGRAQHEIDFLAAELTRAVGLSGRERRAGAAADRARVTVQKRIRNAIGRIEKGAPSLGRYLSLTVQTGTFCVYRPTRYARG